MKTVKTRWLEFKDKKEMILFLLNNSDKFVSWSEETIRCMDYTGSKINYDMNRVGERGGYKFISKGTHDADIASLARKGICIIDDNLVKVHFINYEFHKMEHLFNKEHLRTNVYKYVYKGGVQC